MQRELLWFKEVQKMILPVYREQKNKDGLIATGERYSQSNTESLLRKGERWTKDAISYCVVVAALIATVTFAAAITVPGGYDDLGIPIFYERATFMGFVMADAVSLSLSSTSILIFLSIITSRFAKNDFLESLPCIKVVAMHIKSFLLNSSHDGCF
ncbi:hypothetical protein QVD17_15699 [Tagetes erecta]|uniref:PGG domain-containing protein n=1 Tax=Tagetes erecta TaxID=13708 RepID=A0AAD8KVD6_TARER|nr:hypothetical protein QVD17_15699 [Tagetes erecta]